MRFFALCSGQVISLWDEMLTVQERDSKKDEAIVFIFIFATSGLLAWAVCRPWVEKWLQVSLVMVVYW